MTGPKTGEAYSWRNDDWSNFSALFDLSGDATDVEFRGNFFETTYEPYDVAIRGTMDAVGGITVTDNNFSFLNGGVHLEPSGNNKNLRDIVITHNYFAGGVDIVRLRQAVNARVDSNSTGGGDLYGGFELYNCDSSSVRGNILSDLYTGYGIRVQGDGYVQPYTCTAVNVSGNELHYFYSYEQGIDVSYCFDCTISSNNIDGGLDLPYGIRCVASDGIVISGNSLANSIWSGIAVGSTEGDFWIDGNSVTTMDANAVAIDVSGPTDTGAVHHITANSLIVPSTATGIRAQGLHGTVAQPALIANNEIIGGIRSMELHGGRIDVLFNSCLAGDPTSGPVELDVNAVRFVDNVVSAWASSYSSPVVVTNSDPDNEFGHNIYHYDDSAPGAQLSTAYSDLTAAQAAGSETGSLLMDPQFVDPANSLLPGNAGLAATGIPFGGILYDISGVLRDAIAPTPGAFELMPTTIPSSSIGEPLKVYPNPFHDLLWVQHARLAGAWFRVVDTVGRTVTEGMIPDHGSVAALDLQHLLPGQYVLHITTSKGMLQVPILRMH